jgi:alpha-aminoadipate/glutamate carrier protein LysW
MSLASPVVSAVVGAAVQPVSCTCPECEGAIRFDREPLRSQVVRCVSCGVELEVVSTAPVQLALAPEVEEDWGE